MKSDGITRDPVRDLGDNTIEQPLFQCTDIQLGVVQADADCKTDHFCLTMACAEFPVPVGICMTTPDQLNSLIDGLTKTLNHLWPDYVIHPVDETVVIEMPNAE